MKTTIVPLPEEYLQLSEEDKTILKTWIGQNLKPKKSINQNHTSYGLKHLLDSDINIYFTNDQFKGGMLDMGFIPDNPKDLNWCFNVSEKSITQLDKRMNGR